MHEVWFWQRIISPHMVGLAHRLAARGARVTYVAEKEMSADRKRLGWTVPLMGNVRVHIVRDQREVERRVAEAPSGSIHLCQGIRGNGLVSNAQKALAKRGLQQWVVMETVNDSGARGSLKRILYSLLFRHYRSQLTGVLATGHRTASWVVDRGMPIGSVWPFAYFLNAQAGPSIDDTIERPFRFLFVGRLDKNKRLQLLIKCLAKLDTNLSNFVLIVVGTGELETDLRSLADKLLPSRVQWLGTLQKTDVYEVISQADCLVLPSMHDGWGAVISEALIVGTPAICSDTCGAAGVVLASGKGGVFAFNDEAEFRGILEAMILGGPISSRARESLAHWATVLNADAGAHYLTRIFQFAETGGQRPLPPWLEREQLVTS